MSAADVFPAAMFTPQGFPDGQIMWDLSTSVDREHEYLETFELHRRTFAIIAVADHAEINDPALLSQQLDDLKLIVSSPEYAYLPPRPRANLDDFCGTVPRRPVLCLRHV